MSLESPNKAERDWMDAIVRFGCCVCMKFHGAPTPPEVHHILSGGRRISHLHTLPLCAPGHHRYADGVQKISRHPTKARFEAAYGTEAELLAWTQIEVAKMERRAA